MSRGAKLDEKGIPFFTKIGSFSAESKKMHKKCLLLILSLLKYSSQEDAYNFKIYQDLAAITD